MDLKLQYDAKSYYEGFLHQDALDTLESPSLTNSRTLFISVCLNKVQRLVFVIN